MNGGFILSKPFFKPWCGKNYENTKILILSESAYSWEENGKVWHPSPSHPTKSLLHWINHFEKRTYYRSLSQALCNSEKPTIEQALNEWNNVAYTIFVQSTVGIGARKRPSSAQWKEAKQHFLNLIERISPKKVIVTGLDMWNKHMPGCNGPHRTDYIQAYKLTDGSLVWCLAIPHPSNSTWGFRWDKIGKQINDFKQLTLPTK
jgi:hypothetical protein